MRNIFKSIKLRTWIIAGVAAVALAIVAAAVQNAVKPAAPAPDAASLLAKTLNLYSVAPSYEVRFYLQQPKNPRDATNPDMMEKLRETYRLLYRRGAKPPLSDHIRLEGEVGMNQKTIIAYPDKGGKVIVYRPNAAALETPPDDKRMVDFFRSDLKQFAADLLEMAKDPKNKAAQEEGPCKSTDSLDSRNCFKITIDSPGIRKIAYVNKAGYSLERLETFSIGKSRDGADVFQFLWRMEWFGYKARDISDVEFSKPIQR